MKTRTVFQFYLSIILLFLILISDSCKKDEPKIIKQKVTGHVQKGPFINGTSISMFELNSTLVQTGKIFTTQINNNNGSFEISNVSLTSGYVEFSASGYYFDEVNGDLSIAPLNLFALTDITDISTVNVNILTHLEKLRVEYLVKQNKTFSEAKKMAQGEMLAIFGFALSEMDDFETLDISVNNEGNAILLAISIILQGNRSVGDLTELLANITNNISEDGILNSESIMTNLRNSTKDLVLTTIRSNLQNRYQELGINASIPDFEKYINDFLVFTGQKPATSAQSATNLTKTSATLNGEVNANSLNTIVTFEFGTSTSYENSAIATQSPVKGSSSVNVNVGITGLLPGTTYHFRVKAENSLGSTYSSDLTFETPGTVTDNDGNVYNTVTIGTQVWLTENLKTTKYNDGTAIPLVTDYTAWSNLTAPGYCWYDNDEATYKNTYGALYNWYTVSTGKLCPPGWHVPSDTEWTTLITSLGDESVAGDKLKETGTAHWTSPNTSATNVTGFTALPGGHRYVDGICNYIGLGGYWWSSSEASTASAWLRFMSCYDAGVYSYDYYSKQEGFSVRCLRDY